MTSFDALNSKLHFAPSKNSFIVHDNYEEVTSITT